MQQSGVDDERKATAFVHEYRSAVLCILRTEQAALGPGEEAILKDLDALWSLAVICLLKPGLQGPELFIEDYIRWVQFHFAGTVMIIMKRDELYCCRRTRMGQALFQPSESRAKAVLDLFAETGGDSPFRTGVSDASTAAAGWTPIRP